MTLLLLASLCFQDADALIRSLSSDDIDVRAQAAAGLVKLGEPAIQPMKKALASAEGEMRARLQELIATVEREERRKNFKGGDEVCGLAARVTGKESYKAGDAIDLTCEIMNLSKEARPYVKATTFDRHSPTEMSSYTSSHGRISVKQISGDRPENSGGLRGCGMGPQIKSVELKSGESVSIAIALGDKLNPGEYEVFVTYYAKTKELLQGATADLVTNVLKFKIEK